MSREKFLKELDSLIQGTKLMKAGAHKLRMSDEEYDGKTGEIRAYRLAKKIFELHFPETDDSAIEKVICSCIKSNTQGECDITLGMYEELTCSSDTLIAGITTAIKGELG